jgi:hypothetical protein
MLVLFAPAFSDQEKAKTIEFYLETKSAAAQAGHQMTKNACEKINLLCLFRHPDNSARTMEKSRRRNAP